MKAKLKDLHGSGIIIGNTARDQSSPGLPANSKLLVVDINYFDSFTERMFQGGIKRTFYGNQWW